MLTIDGSLSINSGFTKLGSGLQFDMHKIRPRILLDFIVFMQLHCGLQVVMCEYIDSVADTC